jgi:hypothetical protein
VRPRLRGGDALRIIHHREAKCKRLLLLCTIYWTYYLNMLYIKGLGWKPGSN